MSRLMLAGLLLVLMLPLRALAEFPPHVNEQTNTLVNRVVEIAVANLAGKQTFPPFGAVLHKDGSIELLGRSEKSTAPARDTLALVLAAIREKTEAPDVQAGALVGLMQVKGPKGPIDGIRIEVDHREGVPTIVFLPYVRQASGQLAFGQQATRPGSNPMFERGAVATPAAKAPASAAKAPAAAKSPAAPASAKP